MLSGRGLCDELITRPEESYRLCCVVVIMKISREEAMTRVGSQRHGGGEHKPVSGPQILSFNININYFSHTGLILSLFLQNFASRVSFASALPFHACYIQKHKG